MFTVEKLHIKELLDDYTYPEKDEEIEKLLGWDVGTAAPLNYNQVAYMFLRTYEMLQESEARVAELEEELDAFNHIRNEIPHIQPVWPIR